MSSFASKFRANHTIHSENVEKFNSNNNNNNDARTCSILRHHPDCPFIWIWVHSLWCVFAIRNALLYSQSHLSTINTWIKTMCMKSFHILSAALRFSFLLPFFSVGHTHSLTAQAHATITVNECFFFPPKCEEEALIVADYIFLKCISHWGTSKSWNGFFRVVIC